MRRALRGQPASRGIALGRVRVRTPQALAVEERRIGADEVPDEILRLHRALDATRQELHGLRERLHGALAQEVGEFLDLHAMILDDPELLHGLDDLVTTARYSADYALKLQRDRLAAVFEGMHDDYFRSRREDLDHVIGRVHAALQQRNHDAERGFAGDILVCEAIAPQELAELQSQGVVAVVAATGSPLSHSAILARSLHLPLVLGAAELMALANDGDALMVDGGTGELVLEPDDGDLRRYHRREAEISREQAQLSRLRRQPTRTLDGVDIRLYANAESREDVAQAHALGADGIGLYRTEFLFLQRRELGLINIGGPAVVQADDQTYEVGAREALYIGQGAKALEFSSVDPAHPAKLYFNCAPAHCHYPNKKVTLAEASPETLGDAKTSNRRTIHKFLVPSVLPTCQLLMGMTQLEPGSLWNTMPCHTHDRRMEVYFYFDMAPDAVVFHLCGEPTETRHLVVRNEQAVINPSWSMHSGVGTQAYTFIWGMVGENQVFGDMDHVAMTALR